MGPKATIWHLPLALTICAQIAVLLCCLAGAPAACMQDPDGDPQISQILERVPSELPHAASDRWAKLFDEDGLLVQSEVPPSVLPYLKLSNVAYNQRDFPAALEALFGALNEAPDFPPALLEMGTVYFRLRRYGDSAEVLERFCLHAPTQVMRTQALAHCYYSLGSYEKARAHYEVVLEGVPESVEALRGLALCYHRIGINEKALELLDKVLELRPEHAEAVTWKAQILFEEDRVEEALAVAENATKIDPFTPRPWYLLSQILFDLGQEERAEQIREHWRQLDALTQDVRAVQAQLLYRPSEYGLYVRLAELLSQVGDLDGTRDALVAATSLAPAEISQVELYKFSIDLLLSLDDVEGARVLANEMEEACPEDAEAWNFLRLFYGKTKDTERYIQASEKYFRLAGK